MSKLKFLFGRKKSIYDVLVKEFDTDFYRQTNSDLADIDLLQHYIDIGWKEGRDPAPYFSTAYYLELHSDVRESEVNPFYHYLVHGKKERRRIHTAGYKQASSALAAETTPDSAPEPVVVRVDTNSHEYLTIKSEIDLNYYVNKYPESREDGMDPVIHFMTIGWHKGYNPSPDFSTSYYLENNRDIREAGINPFYHYIVRGRSENRLPLKPGGAKAEILYNLVPLKVRTASYIYSRNIHILDINALIQGLESCTLPDSNIFIISIGHDNYLENTGGVQLVQGIEQDACNRNSINYFHLSPAQPLPVLSSSEPDDFIYNLLFNGVNIGKCRHADVCTLINHFYARNKTSAAYMVVHALHGHSVKCINDLHDNIPVSESFFWTHDYYSLCTGYNLLRNDNAYCNAPPPESNACSLCIYGEERKRHLVLLEQLFKHISFTMVSPSPVSRDIWKDAFRFHYKKHIINPICENVFSGLRISRSSAELGNTRPAPEKIRIAFIGHPASHKGWQIFGELYENILSDERYDVYHLGQPQTYKLKNPTRTVSVSLENRTAMTDAIRETEIDVALFLSIWPETFCIAAYEAMAAGALIVTTKESGNVKVIVETFNSGYVFQNEKELIDAFKNQGEESLYQNVLSRKRKGIPTGKVTHSNMTYDLIKTDRKS